MTPFKAAWHCTRAKRKGRCTLAPSRPVHVLESILARGVCLRRASQAHGIPHVKLLEAESAEQHPAAKHYRHLPTLFRARRGASCASGFEHFSRRVAKPSRHLQSQRRTVRRAAHFAPLQEAARTTDSLADLPGCADLASSAKVGRPAPPSKYGATPSAHPAAGRCFPRGASRATCAARGCSGAARVRHAGAAARSATDRPSPMRTVRQFHRNGASCAADDVQRTRAEKSTR